MRISRRDILTHPKDWISWYIKFSKKMYINWIWLIKVIIHLMILITTVQTHLFKEKNEYTSLNIYLFIYSCNTSATLAIRKHPTYTHIPLEVFLGVSCALFLFHHCLWNVVCCFGSVYRSAEGNKYERVHTLQSLIHMVMTVGRELSHPSNAWVVPHHLLFSLFLMFEHIFTQSG